METSLFKLLRPQTWGISLSLGLIHQGFLWALFSNHVLNGTSSHLRARHLAQGTSHLPPDYCRKLLPGHSACPLDLVFLAPCSSQREPSTTKVISPQTYNGFTSHAGQNRSPCRDLHLHPGLGLTISLTSSASLPFITWLQTHLSPRSFGMHQVAWFRGLVCTCCFPSLLSSVICSPPRFISPFLHGHVVGWHIFGNPSHLLYLHT